jgi:hypothetical protein
VCVLSAYASCSLRSLLDSVRVLLWLTCPELETQTFYDFDAHALTSGVTAAGAPRVADFINLPWIPDETKVRAPSMRVERRTERGSPN